MKVNIVSSGTWMRHDIDTMQSVLDETILDFVKEGDSIINIEMKENNGQNRFWIYVLSK